MDGNNPDPITVYRRRWDTDPRRLNDIVSCLCDEPVHRAVIRILDLPWYNSANGFYPLTFSPEHPAKILDLRGILLRKRHLRNIQIPFALLDGADFYKSDLQNANLSFVRAIRASFSEANLRGADLTAARLENSKLAMAILQNAILTRAKLKYADLGWADLRGTKFDEADLINAFLEHVECDQADFQSAKMGQCDLSMARGFEVRFDRARMTQVKAVASKFFRSSFKNAVLNYSDFSLSHFEHSNFTAAQCTDADFTRANLNNCEIAGIDFSLSKLLSASMVDARLLESDFKRCDLRSADFRDTTHYRCSYQKANLSAASLLRAHFSQSDFRGADLSGCQLLSPHNFAVLDKETKFGWTDNPQEKHRHWIVPPLKYQKKQLKKDVNLVQAESLTNQIRVLYRNNDLHRKASDYYFQERYWHTRTMQMEGHRFSYWWNIIFAELLTGYGEKPGRLVGFSILFLLLASFFFMINGITVGDQSIQWHLSNGFSDPLTLMQQLGLSFLFALQCFTLSAWQDVHAVGMIGRLVAEGVHLVGFVFAITLVTLLVKKTIKG